jgi:HK97 family phage major capsid protein
MEIDNLADDATVQMTGADVKALRDGIVDQATLAAIQKIQPELNNVRSASQADALFERVERQNIRTMGSPNSMYRDAEDYARKRDFAKRMGEYCALVAERNFAGLEKFRTDNGDMFPEEVRAYFNETTSGEGAELVPTVWSGEIINVAEQFGYARSIANIYPMSGPSEKLFAGGSITAGMVGEQAAPTAVDAASFFSTTTLTAKTGAAAFLTTIELLKDAKPAYFAYLTRELGRAIAKLEDTQYFLGDGTGNNHTGLINTSGVEVVYMGNASNSGKTAFSNISWKDLINLMLSVNVDVTGDAIFVAPQSVFGHLIKEVDAVNGRPIWDFNAPLQAGKLQGGQGPLGSRQFWTPLGVPMLVVPDSLFPSSAANRAAVIYGDHRQFGYFGDLEGIGVETYKESYNGIALSGVRRLAVEITERFAIAFPAATAFGILKTSLT